MKLSYAGASIDLTVAELDQLIDAAEGRLKRRLVGLKALALAARRGAGARE